MKAKTREQAIGIHNCRQERELNNLTETHGNFRLERTELVTRGDNYSRNTYTFNPIRMGIVQYGRKGRMIEKGN